MPHAYTEDQLVERPAIGLFAELGWTTVSAFEEIVGRNRGDETHLSPAESQSLLTSSPAICLGRETKGEVEILANDRQAIGRCVYPSRPDSLGVSVFANGGAAKVKQVKAWAMAPSNPY